MIKRSYIYIYISPFFFWVWCCPSRNEVSPSIFVPRAVQHGTKSRCCGGFGDAASNVGGHGEGESCFGKLFCSQTSWCVASWCTQHQVFKRFLFLPLRHVITLEMFLGLRCQIWKFLVKKILSVSGSEVNQS